MKPVAFEYCRPDSLDEALDLLSEFGADASVLAGGLSLGAMLNMRLVRPAAVIDVNRLGELGTVEASGGVITTGALVRQAAAMASAEFAGGLPLVAEALPHVGHYQTRPRGTLGGSVAHADPSAEIPLCLVTLGGTVMLRSKRKRRTVPAAEFFQGVLTTDRRPEEMVTALDWPERRGGGWGYAFEEIAQRRGDFAIIAVAAAVRLDGDGRIRDISVGLGGVEDRPFLADTDGCAGLAADAGIAREIAEAAAAAAAPVTDLQATPQYRRELVRVLGARTISRAFDRARGAAEVGGC